MLTIFNSQTKQKEPFKPLQAGKVQLYVCGSTVYDYCHLGHARMFTAFDIVVRYLRFCNYDVKYVRNITDIDDKIITRANENGETIQALTERFIQAMHDDLGQLGLVSPDQEPKATEFIQPIITMIETLIAKGYAYHAEQGDVLYQVEKFANYGKLAHKDLEHLQAGARVEVTEQKRNPLDFVLWKQAKPGEPSWDSPWGKGRPGWHIECSAMSTQCLAPSFDIHGGGGDLKFPHHENEIAQSEAATGQTFVNYWMHVGFVQINKEKMSKSLGNFFTLRDVLQKYHPEIIRYFMIASHYRSPINYSTDSLELSRAALERFYTTLRDVAVVEVKKDSSYEKRFNQTMDDDFNTPEALAVLFDLTHEINRLKVEGDLDKAAEYAAILRYLANVLGILQADPLEFLHTKNYLSKEKIAEIESLIKQREQARAEKQWDKADSFRQALQDQGVTLEDSSVGTRWRMKG